MKKVILASILMLSTSLAFADQDLSKDIQSYAQMNNVTIDEANRALQIEAHKEELLKIIEDEYKGRIAGIYIKNSPEYKIVVRLKGNGSNKKRELSIENSLPGIKVPVEFEYGAKATREVAKGQLQKAQKLAEEYFSTVQIVSYNDITGNIDIEVNEELSPEVSSKIDKLKQNWKNPNVDINVVLVNYSIVPTALAYGGTPVVNNPEGYCTTAFGVKDSSGKKYMSTAAHCPNNFEEVATGTKYYFVNEIPYTQGTDIQWNSTSSTVTNQFRVDSSTTRTLTGRRTLASTNIGDSVCHYGHSTQYSCGKVGGVGVSIASIDPKNGYLYPGNSWVRVNTSVCKPGDSGGPVFTAGTIASGIVSLQMNDDDTKKCIGYLYAPTDKIYENGLSFVY